MKTERVLKKNAIRAYKAFNNDLTCIGFQYEVGKEYHHKGELKMCCAGFHACPKLVDCFSFYPFSETKTRVAEVLVWGKVEHEANAAKLCASNIKVVRELTWNEVLSLCNTGNSNSGNRNTGNSNSGNRNTGNSNSGDWNSGDCNSGDCNTGDNNTGYYNSGNRNTGNSNSGDWNSGNNNSGYHNRGNYNSGSWNSGNWNSGDCNSGSWNSGDCNSGNRNSGNNNSGNNNSGSWNSGSWNSGDCNSGYHNRGDWHSGIFNTEQQEYIFAFNKPALKSAIVSIYAIPFLRFDMSEWIPDCNMSQEEKENHPEYTVTEGYLKRYGYKEAFRKSFEIARRKPDWPEQLEKLKALPNFDAKIFEEISGITPEELGISNKDLAAKTKRVMKVTVADLEKRFGCKVEIVSEK